MTEELHLALTVLHHPLDCPWPKRNNSLGLPILAPRHDGDRGFETSWGAGVVATLSDEEDKRGAGYRHSSRTQFTCFLPLSTIFGPFL